MFSGQHVSILGGNFTECACNAVRSLIAFSNKNLTIEFRTDAIYEINDPSVLTTDQLATVPTSSIRSRTLAQLMTRMSDEMFMDFLRRDFIAPDGLPCPEFTPAAVSRAGSYHYAVFRAGRFLGQIGDRGREIHFDFN